MLNKVSILVSEFFGSLGHFYKMEQLPFFSIIDYFTTLT
jgi:hypothetical protein